MMNKKILMILFVVYLVMLSACGAPKSDSSGKVQETITSDIPYSEPETTEEMTVADDLFEQDPFDVLKPGDSVDTVIEILGEPDENSNSEEVYYYTLEYYGNYKGFAGRFSVSIVRDDMGDHFDTLTFCIDLDKVEMDTDTLYYQWKEILDEKYGEGVEKDPSEMYYFNIHICQWNVGENQYRLLHNRTLKDPSKERIDIDFCKIRDFTFGLS